MTSRQPSWMKKRGHCHGHSFDPIFMKFGMWLVIRFTKFGIAIRHSTSSTSGQNDSWKTVKTESDANSKKKVYSDWFRPTDQEYVHI